MMSSQEVPQGYKQTKVGVVPEEWEEYTLKDILNLTLEPLKMEDEKEYELITVRRRFGGVDSRGLFKGKEILVKNQFFVRENNFVISKRQISHGACGLVPKELDGAIVSNEYNVFQPNIELLNQEFFNYYVRLPKFSQTFYNYSDGVHIEKLLFKTQSWLKQKIPFPPLKEQQKIAQILTTWDVAISKQETLIQEKVQLKKGLMQRLLSGNWDKIRLEDLCNITRGASPRPIKKYITNDVNGVNWLKIGDIDKEAKYITKTKENITLEGSYKSRKIEPNDFILSNSMSFGRPYISKISAYIHDGWLLLRNKNKKMLLDTYLYEILSSSFIKKQFLMMAAGSGVKNLKSETVRGTRIPLPPMEEQQKIAKILTTADKEIELLKEELEALKEQKRGLMQRLLTGEVRVRV